ncbi:hypothetical protein [Actinotalea solisilvae]|uniref:hypothetical protein n=1 Tax=Actinotalea solisilvae TaxID=2072922 RepID=UPI0018F24B6A|nr:hypothetical protein [Actinotalea solisilvae]
MKNDKHDPTGPEIAAFLGFLATGLVVVITGVAAYLELRKAKIAAQQDEDLRQLVHRYERLAETTLDAQQRAATEVADLRARTTSIEQLLRTVE